jgi:hypothetical protein
VALGPREPDYPELDRKHSTDAVVELARTRVLGRLRGRARYDLGQIGFIHYWIKAGIRWPAKVRRWYIAEPRSRINFMVWKLKKWWKEWRHRA